MIMTAEPRNSMQSEAIAVDWLRYFPDLHGDQVQSLNNLPAMYRAWNSQINVISRKDEEAMSIHHVLHSLALAKVMAFTPGMRVLDIGTGGGFPAIPWRLSFRRCNGLRSIPLAKIKVVQDIARQLGLTNLEALHSRAEQVPGPFDFAISRAVARMALLVDWTESLLSKQSRGPKPNGWLVLKGGDLQGGLGEELKELGRPFEVYPVRDFLEDPFLTKNMWCT